MEVFMRLKKKFVIGSIVIMALVAALVSLPNNNIHNYADKYTGTDELNADVKGIGRDNTYSKYIDAHAASLYPSSDIIVKVTDYSKGEGVEQLQEFEGKDNVISTTENSYVEWQVQVPEAGMYQIYMEYYPVKARGVDIERKLSINGEIPFLGADTLIFTRLWTDKSEPTRDNQGNDIRPSQIDVPDWTGAFFKDNLGYFTEPYRFYFEKGINTVGFEAVNEPVIIKSLTLCAVKDKNTYSKYRKNLQGINDTATAADYKQVIQGEASILRSSPSLYALYDRASSNTVPYNAYNIRLNMIGGYAWRVPGQWIEWGFDVPEDGYYNISMKGRQNYNRGFVSNRTVYIDGEIPFSEMEKIGFQYTNKWNSLTLSDEDNNAYQFYLQKGKHLIRLEVTLGDLGFILNEMQDSVYRLNSIYRKILVLTGTTPDRYRDYKIAQIYPEVINAMDLESKRLYKMVDEMVAYSGQKASQTSTMLTLAQQLARFVDNPDRIPKSFQNFKDNISAMGTSILTLSEAPLDIDYITITGTNAKPDKVKETFVDRVVHEAKSFAASFFIDYNAVGDVYDKEEAIQVWILSGRDQSTILKTMIDDTFTPNQNIKVNVKLVDPSIVLNSVTAGKGPDVVLSAMQGEPVNYALRNAVEDITQFSDYQEVLDDFNASSYQPYCFEDGIFALPETQTFNVLFYRKDIMEELGLEVPRTWDDLLAVLPTIQQNNMTVAIPTTERVLNNVSNPDLSGFYNLLYQYGGTMYNPEGKGTAIDSESGVQAFETYTKLFLQYKLPTIYDFPNFFRSGLMPLGIADYNVFNTLVVFAPEIRGLWDFTLVPGTVETDGSVNNSVHTWGTCAIMLKQEDENKKQNAWNFMKWWVSTDTQVRFGKEMESIMGASARYATANINAFKQLSWSHDQLEVLEEQRNWSVGMREIAGGYYSSRHITNAIRRVINQKEDPRETLLDYTTKINEEIIKKRLEFGLDAR
jgi:ABC-type glycerol-3-phosphate transport system substrate-binding protein